MSPICILNYSVGAGALRGEHERLPPRLATFRLITESLFSH